MAFSHTTIIPDNCAHNRFNASLFSSVFKASPMYEAIDNIGVAVADLDAALAFYDTLG
jgi:hypothetical protein